MELLVLHPNRLSARRLAAALECPHAVTSPDQPPEVLIRFGAAGGEEGSLFTLNRRQALLRLKEAPLSAFYRLHRLPYSLTKKSGRSLTIHVVDGNVVAMETRERLTSTERQKCFGTAIRALYLAGIDFGSVQLSIQSRGIPWVNKVTAAPVLTKELAAAYATALRKTIAHRKGDSVPTNANPIQLGADPEFMLKSVRTGKMIPANRFFAVKGAIGCDQRKAIGELRPRPKSTPRELTEAIGSLLTKASEKVQKKRVALMAGSMPFAQFPIGGHIHFGSLNLNFRLLQALDNYLLIPLFCIERKRTAIRRRKYYGCVGDIRPKGPGRFEYRAPSSWLVSPAITLAALSLAKLVAEHAPRLERSYFADLSAVRAFYQGDKEYFRLPVKELRQDLTSLPGYSDYATDLQPLWQMIDEEQEWDEEADLCSTWELGQ
ncbi:hypothetical protein H1S01_06610 [Heliobacterium chlorum]|uniref:PhiEco32-like amidoligase-type 2 protein n=1 Tax=Heliobacterium chlorum TaxID=2698 RepID=A0ABR7T1V6_HELCL|nr:hypothetical protein [Heliobacterium chlorum]